MYVGGAVGAVLTLGGGEGGGQVKVAQGSGGSGLRVGAVMTWAGWVGGGAPGDGGSGHTKCAVMAVG